jgi:NAD(P)-dependent dehydrogenase (short-subunit alcohol dehydrogenase family)
MITTTTKSVAIVTGASQGIGRATRGDCRSNELSRIARCEVDDRASLPMDGGQIKGI